MNWHPVDADRGCEDGVCVLCGQQLLRTATDCWHPWNIKRPCPPEVDAGGGMMRPAFGVGPFQPGRDCWRPRR